MYLAGGIFTSHMSFQHSSSLLTSPKRTIHTTGSCYGSPSARNGSALANSRQPRAQSRPACLPLVTTLSVMMTSTAPPHRQTTLCPAWPRLALSSSQLSTALTRFITVVTGYVFAEARRAMALTSRCYLSGEQLPVPQPFPFSSLPNPSVLLPRYFLTTARLGVFPIANGSFPAFTLPPVMSYIGRLRDAVLAHCPLVVAV